ncbi:VCBS repeat-containing protein [Algoriphagus halophytocola]|uniref:VCBS repeat-containing protein n=1 Tax=Algoriphagus halophytocola TaxID=2991499 RepID=A0ABY6MFA2_9BACT|nr:MULTISPECIES: VCBS repeat-containing protein [unclassified Algoriphagus]UZD21316.1 VCBS repeat-containing protein [Algoriphagus sp. TR-M5]WBL42527.1 VCBS repeat-containing protein [Algoriphagus sp. TR-M9]
MMTRNSISVVIFSFLILSCSGPDDSAGTSRAEKSTTPAVFELLQPEESGITFSNQIEENLNLNVLMYEYLYNGGGVAIGDLNQDGLDDIYFSANVSGSQLYLNEGELKFKEITQLSGVSGRNGPWKTGVVFVDINGDNKLDIYQCYSGNLPPEKRTNQLFVNQGNDENGIPIFEEMAAQYGIASSSPSTSASFFDFDLDGDLDLFLLNHNTKSIQNQDVNLTQVLLKQKHEAGPQLFENKGGKFEEITLQAGISSSSLSYGLGVAISDINQDGYPDIYIGNDYAMPDYLYINQGDGTFQDEILDRMGHVSHFSMGNDIADYNNDGLQDIFTLDMLPEGNERQKLLLAPDNFEKFQLNVDRGFHHQYMRNMLQVNAGDGTFQEIGQLAGVSNTDWSWAPLFADFDNDGWKDLFVTNGYLRDYNNQDFLKYMDNYVRTSGGKLKRQDLLNMVKNMPSSNLTNYIFQNSADLTFQNQTSSWGIAHPANSSGAAYSDLDNDGDLDLVINNINLPAFVYKNRSAEQGNGNYLKIKLSGENGNSYALGAKVTLYADGQIQMLEQNPYRGYQSSISPILHFGLGETSQIDSLKVSWPGGKVSLLNAPSANQTLELKQADAERKVYETAKEATYLALAGEIELPRGRQINDYKRQPLLINPVSGNGKAMVLADFNGDGREDLFLGSGPGVSASLQFQGSNGDFSPAESSAFAVAKDAEDTEAIAFDANGDGFMDLYVASGGVYDYNVGDEVFQDRLYLNDGKGKLSLSSSSIPTERFPTGTVSVMDFNFDGNPDLFVGARLDPGQFPTSLGARVYINDGQGNFSDQTKSLAPTFVNLGMLTDSAVEDLDGDGRPELIVLGEAMPIQIFSFQDEQWRESTLDYFAKHEFGMWYDLKLADWDGDGRVELLAGNLGLNSQIKASDTEPAEILYKDFDGNGSVDAFLGYYIQGEKYPAASRDEILGQVLFLKKRYLDFKSFANVKMNELFTASEREGSSSIYINRLETTYFVRNQEGKFEARVLPIQAQISPVYAVESADVNGDGNLDILMGGNIDYGKLYFGKYDANQGVVLLGNGAGQFTHAPKSKTGLSQTGTIRKITGLGERLFFYSNDSQVSIYTFHPSKMEKLD